MKAVCLLLTCLLLSSHLSSEWDPQKLQTWEKETITDIFTTMAEKSVPSLIFESFRLKKLGDRIHHLPPLQFLGYIMTDPRLKDCIRIIQKSFFKWPFFIEGVEDTMDREYYHGCLFSDLPEFARLTGSDLEKLKRCCENQEWEEFVKALL